MYIDIELINQFLLGTIAVLVLVLIGGTLAHMFRSMSKRFTFTRTALIIALPPFCFYLSLDRGSLSTLYLFGIVMVLLGYLIDGIKHLLLAWRGDGDPNNRSPKTQDDGTDKDRVIWEKVD